MSSLTDIATNFKKIAIISGIVLVSLIALIFVIKGLVSFKDKFFPAKSKIVLSEFGKLPPIDFDDGTKNIQPKLTYQIETIDGTLGNLPETAKVYKFVNTERALLALDKAKTKVSPFGFKGEPVKSGDNIYVWSDSESGRQLTYDIATGNFKVTSERLLSLQYLSSVAPTNEEAIQTAKTFLSNNELLKKDMTEEKITTTPLKIDNLVLKKAVSLSDANFVRVNFGRADLDKIPLLGPTLDDSLISVMVAGRQTQSQLPNINYHYQEIDEKVFSSYPLKTASIGLEDLKNGKGRIVSSSGKGGSIFIRKVYLGYYLPRFDASYLQPVIVFDSLDGFLGVVPAVADDQIDTTLGAPQASGSAITR